MQTTHGRIIHANILQEYFEGTVYTFGFGPDHDADLLEAISTQGGGVYYFIDTNEKVCVMNERDLRLQ